MGHLAFGFQPGLDEAGELEVLLGAHRHVDMAAFRGRNDAALRGRVNGGRIDAGAKPDHQHRGPCLDRAGDHGPKIGLGDMAKRLALGLQVVQDRHLARAGRGGKLRPVHHPVEVGHGRDAVLHRAGSSDADAGDCGPGLVKIVAQDLGDVLAARLVFGVREAADRVDPDAGAFGQRDAGVGAADVG